MLITPAFRKDIQKVVSSAIRYELANLHPPRPPIGQVDAFGIARVMEACCRHFKVTMGEMKGKCRDKSIVDARHTANWLARKITGASYPEIGRAFGNRDHTTILHAIRRIDNLRERYEPWREKTDHLLRELGQ